VSATADWGRVRHVLEEAVDGRVFPGAALLVACGDEVLEEIYVGSVEIDGSAVTAETVYDLSSLTKPLATTASLLVLTADGRMELERPLAEIYPEFVDLGPADERDIRRAIVIEDVLRHRAGLHAVGGFWRRLQEARPEQVGTRDAARVIAAYAAERPLDYAPRSSAVYSDLGFIMLGVAIERLAETTLDAFTQTRLYEPLGAAMAYRPLSDERSVKDSASIAPCGSCDWRGGVVRGAVQDENAWAMGGVAGHAGLFGAARDVHVVIAEFVAASEGRGRVLDRELVCAGWQWPPRSVSASAFATTWVLGWDTPTAGASSAGRLISPGSVGQLGFTGTSVWIDRTRGVHVILLTNRLHPDRDNAAIRQLRPVLHDAVFGAVDGLQQTAANT